MAKVLIKEYGTNEVVREIPCVSKEKAEKVDTGLQINLDHDKYFTVVE